MAKSIIVEGKTTQDAIEKGLKELKATRSMVEIKPIEEEKKRSFYSILAPRVVKIEMTLKENADKEVKHMTKPKRETNKNIEEIEKVSEKISEFFKSILDKDVVCEVLKKNNVDYIAESKFVPTQKEQRENIKLINNLYQTNNYPDFLTKEQKNNLMGK